VFLFVSASRQNPNGVSSDSGTGFFRIFVFPIRGQDNNAIRTTRSGNAINEAQMKIAISLFIGLVLSGCANLNSVYRELNVDNGTGAIIDIKQRAIFSSQRGEGKDRQTMICAEPSPDSLSAYAAEFAAKGSVSGKETAGITSAVQEDASFVGLRTQSIQLLRDSLYRLCEGYMSGALDKQQYDILMRRYQRFMVALLAIEQLTGVLHSPAVRVDLENRLAYIKERIPELEKEKEALNGKAEEQAEIQKKIDSLNASRKEIKNEMDKKIGNLEGDKVTKGNIQVVADTVERIVNETVFRFDDMGQLCWAYLTNENNNQETEFAKMCAKYFDKHIESGVRTGAIIRDTGKNDERKRSVQPINLE